MTTPLIVVSDATPLIALSKIGQLSWLPDPFGEVLIPGAVYSEIVVAGAGRIGAAEIQAASWIRMEAVVDRTKVNYLLTQLDIGEAEAIVLAEEQQADWILVDETKASDNRTSAWHASDRDCGFASSGKTTGQNYCGSSVTRCVTQPTVSSESNCLRFGAKTGSRVTASPFDTV